MGILFCLGLIAIPILIAVANALDWSMLQERKKMYPGLKAVHDHKQAMLQLELLASAFVLIIITVILYKCGLL